MQHQISITNDIACITFKGSLNALDLLFMFQSQEYKTAINTHKKILMDYTKINGVALTAEDVKSLAMLGKIDFENLGQINIVLVVKDNEGKVLESVTKNLFAASQAIVQLSNSSDNAMKILNKT